MNEPDICHWNLEFSFRNNEACKQFIKRLLKLHFTLKFTYEQYNDEYGYVRYRIHVEGYWAKSLTVVSKLMEKVDYGNE